MVASAVTAASAADAADAALSVTVAVAVTSTWPEDGSEAPPLAVIFTAPPETGIYTLNTAIASEDAIPSPATVLPAVVAVTTASSAAVAEPLPNATEEVIPPVANKLANVVAPIAAFAESNGLMDIYATSPGAYVALSKDKTTVAGDAVFTFTAVAAEATVERVEVEAFLTVSLAVPLLDPVTAHR